MSIQKGSISVQTENIFPIIKKFLYSDHEIFLRELVSNAVDATTKLRVYSAKGEPVGDISNITIDIIIDKDAKTLTIRDRGIGMTLEEVEKYLNQVAFSSAQEFIDKYKDDAAIIGHFGLGFYSAFMVAGKVDVQTLSWKKDATAVKWSCTGEPEYTIEDITKEERGTDIVLHITDDSLEFLENNRIQELLDKYCKFLPVEIRFGTKKKYLPAAEEGGKSEEVEVDNIINNPNPLWKKQPNELGDEDYKNFYNELYPYSSAPLFWIHLNIDYPFNLTGVLYFPKLSNNLELQKNKIQLYSNQVFVTEDVKEIMPEFLTLLHGVIDSPDIPLNVSRSYLQADQNVKKITGYITKKVAEKLQNIFDNQREEFQDKWSDVGNFVKYGMVTDDKFYEKGVSFCLVKNTANAYFTISEYQEKIKAQQTDKNNKIIVLYTTNVLEHDAYIQSVTNYGYDVLVLDQVLDNHYIQQLESKFPDLRFKRVDSDVIEDLIEKEAKKESVLNEEQITKIKDIFTQAVKLPGAEVATSALGQDDMPVTIVKPEFMRRMKEMQAMQGMSFGDFPDSVKFIINTNHPIVTDRLTTESDEDAQKSAAYLMDLALLSQQMLKGPELTRFLKDAVNRA